MNILKEKSSASVLGISDIQLKTIHGEIGIAHNAEIKSVKNKSELKNAITSDNPSSNGLIGKTGDGDLFVARKFYGGDPYFNVYRVSVDGKITQEWSELSTTKAIAKFTGVKEYFSVDSENLYDRKGYSNPGPLNKEDELDNVRDTVQKFTVKLIEKEFKVIKDEVKVKISEYIKVEDFKSARALMERLYRPAQYSFDDDKPISVESIINGTYSWSNNRNFWSEISSFLQKRKSPGSIRKRAAELARKYSNEVRQKLLRNP